MFSLLLPVSRVQLLDILEFYGVILVQAFRHLCLLLASEDTCDDYGEVGNGSTTRRGGPDQRQRIQTKQRLSLFNRILMPAAFLFISTQKTFLYFLKGKELSSLYIWCLLVSRT